MLVAGLLVLLSLAVGHCQQTAGTAKCIRTYQDLKNAVITNANNTQSLLLGFYPPNQSPSHVVNVFYHIEESTTDLDTPDDNGTMFPNFEEPNTTADYIFQWVDSSTLLLTEVRLFQALSFYIAQLTISEVMVVLPPFCNESDSVWLLNALTVWLKSYAVGTDETSRYYSLYFNDEEFVTLNSFSVDSAAALVVFEYVASVGWLIVIYVFLFLGARREELKSIFEFFSQVSPPCVAATLTMVIFDINSYATEFEYSTSEWLRAFPIPIVFAAFSVVNLPLAIAVVVVHGSSFPLPGLMKLVFKMCTSKCGRGDKKIWSGIVKVVLIFSVTSVGILGVFHVVWVVLAFSAYPVRAIASQAFTIPFVIFIFLFFMFIDYVASSEVLIKQASSKSHKICLIVSIIVMVAPFTVALLGVFYYYSQALVDVNDSENNPIKTIIAGVTPALAAALCLWVVRAALKGIEDVTTSRDADGDLGRDASGRTVHHVNLLPLHQLGASDEATSPTLESTEKVVSDV